MGDHTPQYDSSSRHSAMQVGSSKRPPQISGPSVAVPSRLPDIEPVAPAGFAASSRTPSRVDIARRRIGDVLDDKWTLDDLLGVGGMAAVYSATHRNGARAAIKLLPFTIQTGPEVCQRLLREGYLANRIQHEAVVRVLDDHIDFEHEHAYIVMELLQGETARERFERSGPLEPAVAVELMIELAECLSAAHTANVIHRDIKPENLFLTTSGLKVLDFGIARALDGAAHLTQTGTTMGTPAYMAPEQARGQQDQITTTTDLYSVGATLLYLVSGKTLHQGDNPLQLMVQAAWTPAPSAGDLCPGLPEPLVRLIDRCCAFEPAERYPDGASLARALLELSDELRASGAHFNPLAARSRRNEQPTLIAPERSVAVASDHAPRALTPTPSLQGATNPGDPSSPSSEISQSAISDPALDMPTLESEIPVFRTRVSQRHRLALIALVLLGGVGAWVMVTSDDGAPSANQKPSADQKTTDQKTTDQKTTDQTMAGHDTLEREQTSPNETEPGVNLPSPDHVIENVATSADAELEPAVVKTTSKPTPRKSQERSAKLAPPVKVRASAPPRSGATETRRESDSQSSTDGPQIDYTRFREKKHGSTGTESEPTHGSGRSGQ